MSVRARALAVIKADTPFGRRVRRTYRRLWWLSVPMPGPIARGYRSAYVLARDITYWFRRAFVAEPIFRGYASSVGRNFHTGVFVHWITGDGRIVVGSDSLIDGKCSIMFAWSGSVRPEFIVGDRTHIGHDCHFTIARSVRIGNDCMFASGVRVMDSSAHPVDPVKRLRGDKPLPEEIQPVVIEDNVWVGSEAIILPGVTIGAGSVVAAGAIVTKSVPPACVAAGVPAKVVRSAVDPDPSVTVVGRVGS